MNQQLCVLLYSKYSPNCKNFMDMLKQSPVDFTDVIQLNPLCIDNEDIRASIMRSNNIDVQVVPCVLLVYPDGGVEKYEGETAFQWAEEIVRKHAPPPPPIVYHQPPPPPVPLVEDVDDEEDYVPNKKEKRKKKKKKPVKKAATMIEDLDSDEDCDEDEYEEIRRPPVGVRSGAGNYEIKEEFGVPDEQRRDVTHGIKTSTSASSGGKKVDLMSAAMAMQKSREHEDNAKRPAGLPPSRV